MVVSQSPSVELSESQRAVLQKYFINDENTWEAVAERVAKFVASAEATPELREYWQDKFMSILVPMKLVPGGSILANSDHGTRGMLNCFVLSAEDNIHDITKLVSDSVLTTKFRGGVGINIGAEGSKGYIRPKGSPFQDGKALGPCAVLDMVSENSKKITTGNKARRGAFLFSMDWRHPDIWEFIQAKTQSTIDAGITKSVVEQMAQLVQSDLPQDQRQEKLRALNQQLSTAWVETHLSPEGKRDRRWHNANISVQLDDEFFRCLDAGDDSASRLWDTIAQNAHATADPGLLLIDNAKRRSPIRDFVTCTNPCLVGETSILTRQGSRPIESLVGKAVEIWDGQDWRLVDNFRVTGFEQSVFELTLTNGESVKATSEHTFILADGTRKKLKDLKVGEALASVTFQSRVLAGFPDSEADVTITGVGHESDYVISSIEFSHVADRVYCCTVPETHAFTLSNGLLSGNCGEIFLPPNSACNLGSLVLTKFISQNSDGEIEIDWQDLAETVAIAVRFLDNVLDVSEFATPDQKYNVRNVFRQLGLGIMGWADYLKQARIPYDSAQHLDEIDRWGSWMALHAYRASEALAAEKGSCGVWPQIAEVRTGNIFELWVDSEGNRYNGEEALASTRQDLTQVARRNSTVLSIAPTGSIAQLASCSWAFEPDFGLTMWKQVFVDASRNEQNWIQILNPYLEALNFSEADAEIVKRTGSLKGTEFAQQHPEVAAAFKIAREVPPGWHILVQSKWQDWIDSSISKTINLPGHATVDEIKQIYRLAAKAGLKGVTIYRSGTLESEPIKVGDAEKSGS
ncbi:MAG: ribonucleoside-diphosphate reductase, adenosylcobalamin-dependent [Acaryochloridaceae cyanobacterium RU_4_10]|nr:ribonucleoside-diphosphate reductase, adenosylcobalamin-dependent [Acaryochloridaceae cyanobacterium RU_4_10]